MGTVSEQLLYEVSDPGAYLVPDVACDFSTIKMKEIGPNRVEVSNATGRTPSGCYKICGIVDDGWKAVAMIPVLGINTAAKAKRMAEGVLARTVRLLNAASLPPPRKTLVDLIGTGEIFTVAPTTNAVQTEVVARLVFLHDDMQAARIFVNETLSPSTNGSPGSIPGGGGPIMGPVHRLYSFLLPRDKLAPVVTMDGKSVTMQPETVKPTPGPQRPKSAPNTQSGGGDSSVPLIALAWGAAATRAISITSASSRAVRSICLTSVRHLPRRRWPNGCGTLSITPTIPM